MKFIDKHKIKIETLCPIHIGTGEQWDLFSYTIRNGVLYHFISEKIYQNISPEKRAEFDKLLDASDHLKIRSFIAENVNDSFCDIKIKVSNLIEETYNKNKNNLNNQIVVHPFIRTGKTETYIPGSSIKGAIRTAVISRLCPTGEIKKNPIRNDWESIILKYERENYGRIKPDIKTDPFRTIHIEDAYLQDNEKMKIAEVFQFSPSKPIPFLGIDMFSEFAETGAVFTGEIALYNELQNSRLNDRHYFERPINLVDVIKNCNEFYLNNIAHDIAYYERNNKTPEIKELLKNYKSIKDRADEIIKKNGFIIRLGRFSGFEAMTIDEHREFHDRKSGKIKKSAATRNIYEKNSPVGWVGIKVEK